MGILTPVERANQLIETKFSTNSVSSFATEYGYSATGSLTTQEFQEFKEKAVQAVMKEVKLSSSERADLDLNAFKEHIEFKIQIELDKIYRPGQSKYDRNPRPIFLETLLSSLVRFIYGQKEE